MSQQNKIKTYTGNSIVAFDNFNMVIQNPSIQKIVNDLKERGITPSDIEEPDYQLDGMIELSEHTKINVKQSGKMQGAINIGRDEYVFTKINNDIDAILKEISNLKIQHKITDSNYIVENACPTTPTPFLIKNRIDKIKTAAQLIESAILELKHTPKLDNMHDIPEIIKKLDDILESDQFGLKNLTKLYTGQTRD